jgi:nucleotide-binding universal stress UspA family protein
MLQVQPLSFVSADPAADICRTAEAKESSLSLLGAHNPILLGGRLSGTVSDVVALSHCPVAVLVDRGLKKVERVLVAYAGGPEDSEALALASRIGRTAGTKLTLLHVIPPGSAKQPGKGRNQIADALQNLTEVENKVEDDDETVAIDQLFEEPGADSGSVHVRVVEHPSPPDAVLEESKRGYDLIVLGMHARWDLGVGVISLRRRRVLAEAPVSILAVHPPLQPNVSASDTPETSNSLGKIHF